jgi:hypothetical protein
MKHLTIYGASDDLIEIEGDVKGADEYPAEDATFVIGGLEVRVTFDGEWWIACKPVDEDFAIACENIVLTQHEKGYSMQLDMDVPDDAAHIVRKHGG